MQFLLSLWVGRIAIVHSFTNVHTLGCQGYVIGVGGRTHGEKKSAARDKLLCFLYNGELELRYFMKAVFLSNVFRLLLLLDVPRHIAILSVKLSVLSCE